MCMAADDFDAAYERAMESISDFEPLIGRLLDVEKAELVTRIVSAVLNAECGVTP